MKRWKKEEIKLYNIQSLTCTGLGAVLLLVVAAKYLLSDSVGWEGITLAGLVAFLVALPFAKTFKLKLPFMTIELTIGKRANTGCSMSGRRILHKRQ